MHGGGCAWQGAMHGGGAWQVCVCGMRACMAGDMHGRGVWIVGGVHGGGWGVHAIHVSLANTMRYGDTVNEQVVRILLEMHSCSKFF